MTRKDTPIKKIADLKGKRVAVTRGTDPHIFLVRALLSAGMTEHDISEVLLQHPDGKTALIRGDVDAWAGLDPMMAQAEIEDGARLFYRNADANTYGILNSREEFLQRLSRPDAARARGLRDARKYCLANYDDDEARLHRGDQAAERRGRHAAQGAHRPDLQPHRRRRSATPSCRPGLALQKAGVIPATVDVKKALDDLIDDRYVAALAVVASEAKQSSAAWPTRARRPLSRRQMHIAFAACHHVSCRHDDRC